MKVRADGIGAARWTRQMEEGMQVRSTPTVNAVCAACCAALIAGLAPAVPAQTRPGAGILLLAHGGSPQWNERVAGVAAEVDRQFATEVALGMASRPAIQAAVERLEARGVTEIVAVPLFVSSWSSVIRSTEYLLSLRPDAPPDLARFAKMNHAAHGAATGEHGPHGAGPHPAARSASSADGTRPIRTRLPVRITPAINRHALIGRILIDRAAEISRAPEREAVILVAHGPVPDDDNRLWLEDMSALAGHVRAARPFAAVHALTVRDDAPADIKAAATAELRGVVQRETARGRRVLIVPHLMSFGGIEQGMRTRLDGLDYQMSSQALLPDARIAQWVLASAVDPGR
jgi:sirohydrochlorin ferrochelatase